MEEIHLKPNIKEIVPKVNFKQIFDEKLQSIAPLSEQESEWESEGFQDLGIKKIKRKVPAVIFRKSFKSKLQLWTTNPKNIKSRYPHDDIREELEKFLEANRLNPEIGSNASSAYIIQDNENKLYLFFDGITAEGRKRETEYGYDSVKKYEDLMQQYGIEKMMGQFSETKKKGNTTSDGWKMENILDKDIIGRIRENEYLVKFAEKYQMTNNQFMRFRLRAIAGREAALKDKEGASKGISYLIDLDDLAKEVIAQDKEEGHL